MHDLVALGEVMLRLSIPAPARFETIRQLDVQIGGAEANVAAACARLGPKAPIALLEGEAGSVVLEGGRLWRPSRRYQVQVVDPVGAGDAFVAGFLWKTLTGHGVQEAVDAGAAVAALKCATWGDIALVDARDVEDLLAGGPDVRR